MRRNITNPIIFTVFFVLLCFHISAKINSTGTPKVRNYDNSTILAGPQTWMISTSSSGIMYFANNDGLLQFNGQDWEIYPLPKATVVRSVYPTDEGKIYVGGFNEIGYFSAGFNGDLLYHSLIPLLPEEAKDFGDLWKIYDTPQGIVFQCYKQIMILTDSTFHVLKAPGQFHFSYSVHGDIYVNDLEVGIMRLSGSRLVRMPGLNRLKGMLIWSILPFGDNLLIATSQDGIFLYNGLELTKWDNQASRRLSEKQLFCGLHLPNNNYAFGTIQDGFLICDTLGNILQSINLENGLQNNTVLSMQIDQYQNLWLGLDHGIDYAEINSPITYLGHFNGLSAGYTAVLHNKNLYFGTNRGLFYASWPRLQESDNKNIFKIVPGTEGQVWSLSVIDNNLFCGHNSGVCIIQNNKAEWISKEPGGWTFIRPTNHKSLLLCGTYNGLIRFEKINGKWENGGKVKNFSESSRFLANAGKNSFWMSHGYKGIYKIVLNNSLDSAIQINLFDTSDGLPDNTGANVFQLFGKPVFTTSDGFYSFNNLSKQFYKDKSINNLFPVEGIETIYEDKQNNLWYFTKTEAGVFRLQEDGSYRNVDVPFRELKGSFIKGFQFVYPLDYKNTFFGTQKGYVHYTPEYQKNYTQEYNCYIQSVKLLANDSLLYGGNLPTQNSLAISLPFKYNQLYFQIAANDFENPNSLQYATFLEGFEEGWSPWQKRMSKEYTNLPYGDYVFHAKALNIYGHESSKAEISFTILPPWYFSSYGYTLYFFLFLIMLFLFYRYVRYRTQRMKDKEKKRQEQMYREREKQLKTSALEAEKEVIRLRNINLRAEMIQKDKELANATMQMIQKNKSLSVIKKSLQRLSSESNDELTKNQMNTLIRKINREMDSEKQWKVFEDHFENVHETLLKRIKAKYPDLSPSELKLCAYLRLNISSKEIATLMNISTRGVEISRYRLRKKLNISRETNLTEFIMKF